MNKINRKDLKLNNKELKNTKAQNVLLANKRKKIILNFKPKTKEQIELQNKLQFEEIINDFFNLHYIQFKVQEDYYNNFYSKNNIKKIKNKIKDTNIIEKEYIEQQFLIGLNKFKNKIKKDFLKNNLDNLKKSFIPSLK